MTRLYCDGPTLLRAVAAAVANLERHVDEVDAQNVFPVPDGDTGSNMLATMRAALAEAERLPASRRSLRDVAAALRRGALTGARGNSGVILSQIIRGMTENADARRRASGLDLAQGLRRGSEIAYASVLTPVEGTILTVIRDAAAAAESAAGRQPHVEVVLAHAIEAAARSVQRTPSLLPILEDSGVVDSGGQGLFRLLEGTMQIDGVEVSLRKDISTVAAAPARGVPARSATRSNGAAPGEASDGRAESSRDGDGELGYETEFVISASQRPLDIEAIRAALQQAGESLVVAGDEQQARVHIHGPRPDVPIGIGVAWGRLSNVVVKDLDEQVAAHQLESGDGDQAADLQPHGIAVIAIVKAGGLVPAFRDLGIQVVRPAHGTPSVDQILAAVRSAGTAEVLVLPNDIDAQSAAEEAASQAHGIAVHVVATRNPAEGIAAALAFDPRATLARNRERMEHEAGALRSFSVTTMSAEATIDGTRIDAGDVVVLDANGRLLATHHSIDAATLDALGRIGRFELVTCYQGAALSAEQASQLMKSIRDRAGDAEVELIAAGQEADHLLIAVE